MQKFYSIIEAAREVGEIHAFPTWTRKGGKRKWVKMVKHPQTRARVVPHGEVKRVNRLLQAFKKKAGNYVTCEGAARYWGEGASRVKKWAEVGRIRRIAHPITKRLYVSEPELERVKALLEKHALQVAENPRHLPSASVELGIGESTLRRFASRRAPRRYKIRFVYHPISGARVIPESDFLKLHALKAKILGHEGPLYTTGDLAKKARISQGRVANLIGWLLKEDEHYFVDPLTKARYVTQEGREKVLQAARSLSTVQAARKLKVDERTLIDWIAAGLVPSAKLSNRHYLVREEVDAVKNLRIKHGDKWVLMRFLPHVERALHDRLDYGIAKNSKEWFLRAAENLSAADVITLSKAIKSIENEHADKIQSTLVLLAKLNADGRREVLRDFSEQRFGYLERMESLLGKNALDLSPEVKSVLQRARNRLKQEASLEREKATSDFL